MLLELALVVRNAVLAENPAVVRQYGAVVVVLGVWCCADTETLVRRHARSRAADGTYPAIVKSGEWCWRCCGVNGWFLACVGRRSRSRMIRQRSTVDSQATFPLPVTPINLRNIDVGSFGGSSKIANCTAYGLITPPPLSHVDATGLGQATCEPVCPLRAAYCRQCPQRAGNVRRGCPLLHMLHIEKVEAKLLEFWS